MADTITYSGGALGAWDSPTNWDLGRIPAAGDAVIIPTGKTPAINNSLGNYRYPSTSGSFASITFQGSAYLTIDGSGGASTFTLDSTIIQAGTQGNGSIVFASSSNSCIIRTGTGAGNGIIGGTGAGAECVNATNVAALTVIGDVTAGTGATSWGIYTAGATTVHITGNVTGGTGNAAYGVYMNYPTTSALTVVGNIAGGTGAGPNAYGVNLNQVGYFTVTGNITGGTSASTNWGVSWGGSSAGTFTFSGGNISGSANAMGMYMNNSGGVTGTIVGDCVGGGGASCYGLQCQQNGAATITITGNAIAGDAFSAYGIVLGAATTFPNVILQGNITNSTKAVGCGGTPVTLSNPNRNRVITWAAGEKYILQPDPAQVLSAYVIGDLIGTYSPDFPDRGNVLTTDTVNGLAGLYVGYVATSTSGCTPSGLYTETVTIQRAAISAGTYGEPISTFSTHLSGIACRIRRAGDNKLFWAGREALKASHILYCDIIDIKFGDRVVYGATTYDVIGVNTNHNMGRFLTVGLSEVI